MTDDDQRLEKWAGVFREARLEDVDLDETIHELFSVEAVKINNEGLEGQIQYLLDTGWSDKNLIRLVGELSYDKEFQ